jgi:hypothetical protein
LGLVGLTTALTEEEFKDIAKSRPENIQTHKNEMLYYATHQSATDPKNAYLGSILRIALNECITSEAAFLLPFMRITLVQMPPSWQSIKDLGRYGV